MKFLFDGIYIMYQGSLHQFVAYYGIILMLGAVAGGWLAAREAERRGHDPEIIWDLLVWLIVGGVVGARLWHVFTPPPSSIAQGYTTQFYLTHPLDLINLRHGGLGIPGTIIGGAIALLLYCRRHKLSFFEWTDIAAPSLALGQAIGRWGNFFNQELYGAPTTLPWKLYIDPAHRLAGFENYDYYHPLFLYESALNLANMFFLMWLTRRFPERLKRGDVFLVYLIFYPVCRFLLDFLRLDASQIGGININQTLMAGVALTSAAILAWRHRAGMEESAPASSKKATPARRPAKRTPVSRKLSPRSVSRAGKQTARTPRRKAGG